MSVPTKTYRLPPEKFEEGERVRFEAVVQAACTWRQDHPQGTDDELEAVALRALRENGFASSWLPRLHKSAETAFAMMRADLSHKAGNA